MLMIPLAMLAASISAQHLHGVRLAPRAAKASPAFLP
jgi:hypothetical protein